MEFPRAPLPRMAPVRQHLPDDHLPDVAGAVREALLSGGLAERVRPGQRVAITAGSRGIANIATVVKTVAEELRALGAEPFVVPAMGSHGGATVEGQRAILAEYGITEAEIGVPILATMDTVVVGALDDGTPCYLDRHAHEADAIVVVGRVKAHTAFRGDIESGLCKMIAIGLGKQRGAETIHARGLKDTIPAVARVSLGTGKIALGLGLVENAYHKLHTVRAAGPDEVHATDRELLKLANSLLPRVPFDELDLLIVDELGKNVSGSGMDYNIVGMWRRIGGEKRPFYKRIAVLDITPQSEGNGLGVGIADFTTRRLFDQLDLQKTYMNGLTAGALDAIRIPVVLASDRECLEVALKSANAGSAPRVVWIKNTLDLQEMLVSEALLDELRSIPTLAVEGSPAPLAFDAAGALVREDGRPVTGLPMVGAPA
ncbi:MAG: nickel-dependent lactate racemase [Chloroflexota bacterium]|nr:nickel-dependent lactate racemase [Chloroflexota bacterium]